jgi:hypothetical protein
MTLAAMATWLRHCLRQEPPPGDELVLHDDIATLRWLHCTLCGAQFGRDRIDVDAWRSGALVVAVLLCPACQAAPQRGERVDALMRERYRGGRYSTILE